MKRGRRPTIDAAGGARAQELARQGLAQKEIAARLAAEGFGVIGQQAVSRLLADPSRAGEPSRVAARRTKVDPRAKEPQAPKPPEPTEEIPGFDSLSLRLMRRKLMQAEQMSQQLKDKGNFAEWGRLARTIAAIAAKIEAREDELREREEARQRERQSKRDALDSTQQRQGEALAKLRALVAKQEAAHGTQPR